MMLNVIMVSVVMLNVIMLHVIMLSVAFFENHNFEIVFNLFKICHILKDTYLYLYTIM
jgi:hypothetical protein